MERLAREAAVLSGCGESESSVLRVSDKCRWRDGWVDGWMGGWVDRWMGGCVVVDILGAPDSARPVQPLELGIELERDGVGVELCLNIFAECYHVLGRCTVDAEGISDLDEVGLALRDQRAREGTEMSGQVSSIPWE